MDIYVSLGFEILLTKNYGLHLGISDKEYSDLGVKFSNNSEDVIVNSDVIVQLGLLSDDFSLHAKLKKMIKTNEKYFIE